MCARTHHHYVIVRRDLPTGLAGAMILHAAGESGPAPPGSVAILLGVADEPELRELAARTPGAHIVSECDGPYEGQAMAFALAPCVDRRTEFAHLRLWKGGVSKIK